MGESECNCQGTALTTCSSGPETANNVTIGACRRGHKGVLCSSCIDGYVLDADKRCQACALTTGSQLTAWTLVFFFLTTAVVCVLAAMATKKATADDGTVDNDEGVTEEGDGGTTEPILRVEMDAAQQLGKSARRGVPQKMARNLGGGGGGGSGFLVAIFPTYV